MCSSEVCGRDAVHLFEHPLARALGSRPLENKMVIECNRRSKAGEEEVRHVPFQSSQVSGVASFQGLPIMKLLVGIPVALCLSCGRGVPRR